MEILFWAAVVLLVVMFLGHGLWLMAAALLRALSGEQPMRPADRRCASCQTSIPYFEGRCPRCGLDPGAGLAKELDVLHAANRLLRRLRERNKIDEHSASTIERAFLEHRRELLDTPAAAPSPPPQPVTAAQSVRAHSVPASTPKGAVRELSPVCHAVPVEPPALQATPAAAPSPTAPREPVGQPTPPKPRPAIGSLLAAFMEDRNILWGELVGGLLIVGCSVALVISLWQSLEGVPYFPFLLFSAITAALFGAGEYTLHHWKLEATSRGLLIIALLLTPLNLLVLADPSAVGRAGVESGSVTDFAVRLVALLGFVALTRTAGRDVLSADARPGNRVARDWLLPLGIVGTTAVPLFGSRLLETGSPACLLALAALSQAAQAIVFWRLQKADSRRAKSAFTLLGLCAFATGVALGFLLLRYPEKGQALHCLGVILPIGGWLILRAGIWLQGGFEKKGRPTASEWHAVATAGVVAGVAIMLVGEALAWPSAVALLAASAINGVLLTFLAFTERRPWTHAAAIPCLALSAVLGYHAFAGNLAGINAAALLQLLASPMSGVVLAAFAVVLTVASEGLIRVARAADGIVYAVGAAAAGLVGLLLSPSNGIGTPASGAAVYGTCAACVLLSNYRWRRAALSYAGLGLVVATSLWTLQWLRPGDWPAWQFALGVESALLAAGHLRSDKRRSGFAWRDLSVVTGSLVVALAVSQGVHSGWFAATAAALALAGLLLAVADRSPGWLALCQLAASAAVLYAANAWLGGRPPRPEIFDPGALHTYGIGLGVLSLAWVVARAGLRRSRTAVDVGLHGYTVDRLVLAGLVIGQLFLALAGIGPGLAAELTPGGAASAGVLAPVYGPGAQILLALLAVAVAVGQGDRPRTNSVLGLMLLAFTVPVILSGAFSAELATASSLCWGVAACYLLLSAAVVLRGRLARRAASFGIALSPDPEANAAARGVLDLAAFSVTLLTAWLALSTLTGNAPGGPAGSFFGRIGPVFSAVGPLLLLVLGMTGIAVRERSPVYAFIAGLIANAAFVGGYALKLATTGGKIAGPEGIQLLQLATLGSAAWAIIWVTGRRWLYTDRVHLPAAARPLLALQIALAVGGNFLLLGGAVALRGNLLVDALPWSLEAGSSLGAVALLAALGAFAVWHLQRREPLPWQAPFFTGLTLPVLLSCMAERAREGSGFSVLLLAWPGYLLLWSLASLRPAFRKRLFPGVGIVEAELAVATGLASIFTALVAVKAVSLRDAYLPAAASAFLTAVTFTALAVARRSSVLAFLASVLGNVVVSLVVAQRFRDADFSQWCLTLARANVAASSLTTLAWLAARRLLRESSRPGRLLGVQATLGLGVNTLALLVPLCSLLVVPGAALPAAVLPDYPCGGWLALVLATTAAFWHRNQTAPGQQADVLGIFGLSAGVLLACMAAPLDTGNWFSFHVLCAAWSAAGLVAVALGSLAYALRRSGLTGDKQQPYARWFSDLAPPAGIRRWVEVAGGALVLLALRGGWTDPYRPYPSAAALLQVGVMAAALAMWFRRPRHVWASGLLLNLAFAVILLRPESTPDTFLFTNAIGLATGAAAWTLISLALPEGDGRPLDRRSPLPFAHFAAIAAWGLLLGAGVLAFSRDFARTPDAAHSNLTWPAVFAVGVALAAALRDRSARWPVAALYGLGLAATSFALHTAGMRPEALVQTGVLTLAGYVLIAGTVRWSAGSRLAEMLRLPPRDSRWFAPVQLAGAVIVAAAGAWFCLGFASAGERLAGTGAVALVVPAAVLLGAAGRRWSLALATVAMAELACALPDPAGLAPWLTRSACLLAALAVTNLAFSDALPYFLRRSPVWKVESRYCGAAVGLLSAAVLLALLVQEFLLFNGTSKRTPLDLPLVAAVVLAIVWLMTAAVRAAVQPGRDLLGLSGRRRGLYAYAVEALLVLLFLHVRLNVPELFNGWAGKYWPLVVMALAFVGVGLGEFFDRRGLTVFSGPLRHTGLFLPLLPLVAFWAHPPQVLLDFAAGRLPGARPMLEYLNKLEWRYDRYAVLWMLTGLLFAGQAAVRRSFGFGLAAALAANVGVWALLIHGGIPFWAHPQLWMIPLAVIVLVSEHLNRDRLAPETAAGLRYLGVCTVYVSSTADLFIAGLDSVLLPIVLAAFAVAGVLSGIMLRVRAFLFMGVSFLFLDILSMIWHVAVDHYQPWLWWVSGIALGVAILALFAVFEKRRNDVLRLVEEIRRWR